MPLITDSVPDLQMGILVLSKMVSLVIEGGGTFVQETWWEGGEGGGYVVSERERRSEKAGFSCWFVQASWIATKRR